MGRQTVDQDRYENNIVDAENQFERCERREGDPSFRAGQKFNHCKSAYF